CFFLLQNACELFTRHKRTILPKLQHQKVVVLFLLGAALLIALAVFITPLGSLFFLAWGAPGGLLGWYLHSTASSKANINQQTWQSLQQAAQRWN
ncbi:MAG TPA: hypothetical protein VGL94_08830, partial [Ktedonobacteraceae bacterium]